MSGKCACEGGTLSRFIQPIILFSLAESPAHGYRLLEKIAQTELWRDMAPDSAGVYRVLRDMERRGLICSHLEQESKAGIGKRVFELTDQGRHCMFNWIQTLEQYQRGIDQVVVHLREALADSPSQPDPSCCCNQ